MKSGRFVLSILLLTFSANCFAICEKEREERDHFKSLVDGAGTTSSALGIAGTVIGTICLGPVGGLFGLLAAAPAPCGENWKRILDEKEANLKNCEEGHRRAQELAQQNEIDRQARILKIYKKFDELSGRAKERSRYRMKKFISKLVDQGFDTNDGRIQHEITEHQYKLEDQLLRRLEFIERQRQLQLSKT
jgi:hypothetical protein